MLCYVDDALPGITRRRQGRYFAYYDPDGKRITDRDEIDRLNKIGLPPAYSDAWLCPSPHGHIQAIGYDDKGRKQYRYHPEFRAAQEADKYGLCADFGRALPLIRARVENDLANRALDAKFSLSQSKNSEILCGWLTLALRCGLTEVVPTAEAFLSRVGRMKYLKPLYGALPRADAKRVFEANRGRYHPIAQQVVASLLSK